MEKMIKMINEQIAVLEQKAEQAKTARNYYNLLFIEEQLTFLNALKSVTQF